MLSNALPLLFITWSIYVLTFIGSWRPGVDPELPGASGSSRRSWNTGQNTFTQCLICFISTAVSEVINQCIDRKSISSCFHEQKCQNCPGSSFSDETISLFRISLERRWNRTRSFRRRPELREVLTRLMVNKTFKHDDREEQFICL